MMAGQAPAVEELRRSCAEVAPGQWLGGQLAQIPNVVSTVITLEAATAPLDVAGVTEFRFPFRDSRWEPVPHPVLEAAVEAVRAAEAAVLVRCRHGLNRSALVTCLTLMRGGVAAEEAVGHVRMVRPGALTNPYFADLITTYPQEPR
jgi:hypothetical protein